MANQVLTDAVLERISKAVAGALPPGFTFVLLIDNGRGEAARLSPLPAHIAQGVMLAALVGIETNAAPDFMHEVSVKR